MITFSSPRESSSIFTVKLTVKLCVRIPIVPVNFRVNVP